MGLQLEKQLVEHLSKLSPDSL